MVKKGLFLKVDENRLCRICANNLRTKVDRRIQIIEDSAEIANNTKNINTRINRIQDIINILRELKECEDNGIDLNLNFDINKNIDIHIAIKKETILNIGGGRYKNIVESLENSTKAYQNGILTEYTVYTSNDQRVCRSCSEFEGYTAKVIDAEMWVNHPPFHDNCRCFAVYEVVGIKSKNS